MSPLMDNRSLSVLDLTDGMAVFVDPSLEMEVRIQRNIPPELMRRLSRIPMRINSARNPSRTSNGSVNNRIALANLLTSFVFPGKRQAGYFDFGPVICSRRSLLTNDLDLDILNHFGPFIIAPVNFNPVLLAWTLIRPRKEFHFLPQSQSSQTT